MQRSTTLRRAYTAVSKTSGRPRLKPHGDADNAIGFGNTLTAIRGATLAPSPAPRS
jgi:hypothetical protein